MRRKFPLFAAIMLAVPLVGGVAYFAPVLAYSDSKVDFVKFTQPSFDDARAKGKPILVEVHAPWCPTCARQQVGIATAQRDPANKDLVIFRIDFDSQKAVQRPLGISRQSTLIAFKGKVETGRLLGDTDAKAIARLIATTRR